MASCGTCDYCTNRNLPQKCETLFKYGHARSEGSTNPIRRFRHAYPAPARTAIYRIPDGVTDEEVVPINCALATVVNGLKTIGTRPNEAAVIHGAGTLGIYAACYLRVHGYETIAVVDINDGRLETTKRFGATHTFNPEKLSTAEIDAALKELTNGRGGRSRRRGQRHNKWIAEPDCLVGCWWTVFDARLRLPERVYLCRCGSLRQKMRDTPRCPQLPLHRTRRLAPLH